MSPTLPLDDDTAHYTAKALAPVKTDAHRMRYACRLGLGRRVAPGSHPGPPP